MRPKFVFSLILLAFLVVVSAFFLRKLFLPNSPDKPKPEIVTTLAVTPTVVPVQVIPAPIIVPAAAKALNPEEQQAAIDAEKDQLYTWSMSDDSQSLSNILNALTSPEKEVRLAAIEAARQFGSTNAIPALKAAAASSDDIQEQIAMLEAADFISLPEMTFSPQGNGSQAPQTTEQIQAKAQSLAKAEARRQAYLQSHHPDQNAQPPVPANSSDTVPAN